MTTDTLFIGQNYIDGAWRDHYAYALTTEDVPHGVLSRWLRGEVPADASAIPPSDRLQT